MEKKVTKELKLRELYYSTKVVYRNTNHLYKLFREEYPSTEITKSYIKNWLLTQSSYTRFKKWNHPKHYRHTFVRDFDQLQIDLVFMPERYKDENDGYSIILVCIEILSRTCFAETVKDKSGKIIKEALEKIIEKFRKRFGKNPKSIQFDEGAEFLNKDVKGYLESLDINYFFTYSPRKASVVERLNRTIKSSMMRMFEREGNHKWKEHLDNIVENYNDSFHRSIGMKPNDVNEENKFFVWERLFGKIMSIGKPKFKEGDEVRVLKLNTQHRVAQLAKGEKYNKKDKDPSKITFGDLFREKYKKKDEEKVIARQTAVAIRRPPFSKEIFRIDRVLLGDPIVYKLYSEEFKIAIPGKFYTEELSLIKREEDL